VSCCLNGKVEPFSAVSAPIAYGAAILQGTLSSQQELAMSSTAMEEGASGS
jgi:hypothetical protein